MNYTKTNMSPEQTLMGAVPSDENAVGGFNLGGTMIELAMSTNERIVGLGYNPVRLALTMEEDEPEIELDYYGETIEDVIVGAI